MTQPRLTLSLPGGKQGTGGGFLTVRYGQLSFTLHLKPRIVQLILLLSEERTSDAQVLDETTCGFRSRDRIVAKLTPEIQQETLSRYVSDVKREFLAAAKDAGFPADFSALFTTQRYFGMRLTWPVELHDGTDLLPAETGTGRDPDDDDDCIQCAP